MLDMMMIMPRANANAWLSTASPLPETAARESTSSREMPIWTAINSTAASIPASTSDLRGM
jgi:hypothetical protein